MNSYLSLKGPPGIPSVHPWGSPSPFLSTLPPEQPIKTDEPFELILLPQVSCSALATTLDLIIISLFCFHLCCFPIKYCEIQSSIPGYEDQSWHKEPINNTCYWSFCFISILAYNYSVSFLEKMINRSASTTKRDKSQLPTPRRHHRHQLLGLLKPH